MSNKSIGNIKKKKKFISKKTLILLTMVLPGAIWLVLLRYLPMFGIVIAFKDYSVYTKAPSLINNILHSEWVGLQNFKFLFASTESWIMIRNTIVYNAIWIVVGLVVSVTFAIMLNEVTKKFVAKTYQTLMFFPYFISWIVVSYFLMAFIDPTRGMFTHMFPEIGNVYSYTDPWPFILTGAYLWKNTGYSCILYLAAITGIDSSQYEATCIDGASKWQQIFSITLPHIRSMIIVLFIMNVGRIFNSDFGLFYQVPMDSGPLYPVTQTIDTYVYRAMLNTANLGMSTAAGLFQNILGFVCIMTANGIVSKIDADSSLF